MANSTPSSQLLEALGLTQASYNGLDSSQQQQIQQIQQTLSGVSATDQQMLLGQLQGSVKQYESGLPALPEVAAIATAHSVATAVDYGSLLSGIQSATGSGQSSQQQASASSQQQPVQSFVQQYGDPNTIPFGTPPDLSGAPSTQDWATMSKLMGHDAQQAYQAYTSSYQQSPQGNPHSPHAQPMKSAQQWYSSQVTNLQGAWQPLFQAFDADYQMQTGQRMPLALQEQLMQQIQGLAPNVKNSILAQVPQMKAAIASAAQGSDATSTAAGTLNPLSQSGIASSLFDTFNSYAKAATLSGNAANSALQQNISSFVAQTGKAPTQDQINALTGMDPTSLQRYIDALPSPIPGVTMASYQTAVKNTTQLFMDKLGRQPSNQELTKFAGWSSSDIQRWVESQPSKDNPGMTIGTRDSYLSMADAVSNKWFGVPADSRMVDALGSQFGTGAPAVPASATTQIKSGVSSVATPGSKVTP